MLCRVWLGRVQVSNAVFRAFHRDGAVFNYDSMEGPLSALCGRWLTTCRMGEDAPQPAFPLPVTNHGLGGFGVVATRARPDRTIKLVLWLPLAAASTNVAHKEGTTFLAEGVLPHGTNFALIEYTLSPAARLDRIVAEVRRAAQWLAEHLGDYGADPARLYVSRPFGGRSSDRLDDVATRCSGRACYQRYLRSRTD